MKMRRIFQFIALISLPSQLMYAQTPSGDLKWKSESKSHLENQGKLHEQEFEDKNPIDGSTDMEDGIPEINIYSSTLNIKASNNITIDCILTYSKYDLQILKVSHNASAAPMKNITIATNTRLEPLYEQHMKHRFSVSRTHGGIYTIYRLTIKDAEPQDGGIYQCMSGEDFKQVVIDVQADPDVELYYRGLQGNNMRLISRFTDYVLTPYLINFKCQINGSSLAPNMEIAIGSTKLQPDENTVKYTVRQFQYCDTELDCLMLRQKISYETTVDIRDYDIRGLTHHNRLLTCKSRVPGVMEKSQAVIIIHSSKNTATTTSVMTTTTGRTVKHSAKHNSTPAHFSSLLLTVLYIVTLGLSLSIIH